MRALSINTPDLIKMGITEFDVAEQALIRSIELHSSAINDVQAGEMTANPADLGNRILQNMQSQYDPYVDEEPVSLGSWRPPNDEGDFPARWYACAPNNRENWKPTALLGWRTKLERAIQREDEDKVKDIVSRYDLQDIREFVECRMLLTKCAQRGLIDACKLLMEDCKASVEGAQAPDAENWWLDVQNGSGNCNSLTPLHQACRNGQEESVKLLLGHGADINRVDKGKLCGSALHHAVSGGQIDCCHTL